MRDSAILRICELRREVRQGDEELIPGCPRKRVGHIDGCGGPATHKQIYFVDTNGVRGNGRVPCRCRKVLREGASGIGAVRAEWQTKKPSAGSEC